MNSSSDTTQLSYPIYIDKHKLAARISYSPHSFKRWRKNGTWQEGIHFIVINSRTIRYREDVCLNWVANRHNPKAHVAYIKQALKRLKSSGETP